MCTTHFGSPVVPDVELIKKTSSGPTGDRLCPAWSGSGVDGQVGIAERHGGQRRVGVSGGLLRLGEPFDIADHERRARSKNRRHLAHAARAPRPTAIAPQRSIATSRT